VIDRFDRASATHGPVTYMRLPPEGQRRILDQLAAMSSFLAERFGALAEYEGMDDVAQSGLAGDGPTR